MHFFIIKTYYFFKIIYSVNRGLVRDLAVAEINRLSDPDVSMEIGFLTPGIYLIKVFTLNGVVSGKLQVVR
jgi:hypothetical protein